MRRRYRNRPPLMVGLAIVVAGGLSACATDDRYYWGRYEATVFQLETDHLDGLRRTRWADPVGRPDPEDRATIVRSVETLERDLDRAQADGRPVPPGFHAHLAYLYRTLGRSDAAIAQLERERALYPESASFVDMIMMQWGRTP